MNARSLLASFANALTIAIASTVGASGSASADLTLPANILRIEANMIVDTPAEILTLVDDGIAAGATAVLMNDSKATRWGTGEENERWRTAMKAVRDGIAERGLDFGFNTVTLGFASSILATDPNLVAGVPVREQPLTVEAGALLPVTTGSLEGGDLEQGGSDANRIAAAQFQDAPGERTFIDTAVQRSGAGSLRADARDGQMSRIGFRGQVQPWHQYTLSVWMRTRDLTARNLQVVIKDPASGRDLTNQWPSLANGPQREYLRRMVDRDIEWTELRLPFNSQEAAEVQVVLAVFGGEAGSVWWDDMTLEDTPTMNWIRRDGLDTRVTDASGEPLVEGVDIARVEDPLLGDIRYPGDFDTYHAVPPIAVPAGSRLADGDTVLLSGWHAQVTARGQKGASWNDPALHATVARVHRRLAREFAPDFVLYNDSEVRTGGFEPLDAANTGEAFARGARRNLARIARTVGDATILVFGDMHDPEHNARDGYYQIRGDLTGSWRGLDPDRVIVVNWWSKDKLRGGEAAASIEHFASLGFRQILAGYYEEDVEDNRAAWQRAAAGFEDGIVGAMFYTNLDGYDDLPAFGETWWR